MERQRVVVLTGGTSAEREICLKSGKRVLAALDPGKYDAVTVDLAAITGERAAELARSLVSPDGADTKALPEERAGKRGAAGLARGDSGGGEPRRQMVEDGERAVDRPRPPDVVFIALHGGTGENGTVQGMLELLGIPYTGSGVLASALAMDKIMSKKIFEREGIPTPRWVGMRESRRESGPARIVETVGVPCVVKPACEGSTIGVTVVREIGGLEGALDTAFRYGPEALVEEFIAGTEITGAVLGNDDPQVLPLIEIVPASGFYDYEMKYTPGATEEIIPARLPEALATRARELTLAAHTALGCRGVSRVDMMVGNDEVYVLEVNSIPGFTDTSLVPRAAEAVGMSFPQLVDRLIELALEGRRADGTGCSV